MMTVISYDIVEDRTRTRFANFLLDYAVRVQNSVFECYENQRIIDIIKEKAAKEIDLNTDSVYFYEICEACEKKEAVIGRSKPSLKSQNYLIL